MGGEWSLHEREKSPDLWWGSTQPGTSKNVSWGTENTEKTEESECGKVKEEEMDSFKRELTRKRELRHAAIASIQNRMEKLKIDLESERILRKTIENERDQLANIKCNSMLSDEVERLKSKLEEERSKRMEVEEENNKLKEKECELEAVENQVRALKEVTSIGREMLRIRELQVNELKRKLQEIELTMPTAPEELRLEYESQIQNIRKLRTLYEERALATRTEHQQERERDAAKINMLEVKVNELQEEVQEYKDQNIHLESKMTKVEETVEGKINEIESLEDQLHSSKMECHSLKSQMKIINNLFSQVLSGPKFDLDKLTRLLKENHGLIADLTATGDSNEVAALLLDIAEKAEEDPDIIPGGGIGTDEPEEIFKEEKEEIASNLSKVWRVLVELLSHHKDVNPNNAGGSESCYKSVDTPSGPRVVISVSQTFLTLKDLILEKNSLVKEVGRLKTLNKHLETRMYGQERRLSTVTTELKKTWSVVSKLRAQHKQLHNHEKILRYELQHKRQMLTELKQELEHCREKWDQARQKNTQSEEDWKQLRKEFALRKMRKLSNSAESGYEEEDSNSSPSEEINESPSDSIDQTINVTTQQRSDGDLSEEDVEHSDGNSYETVIDLLDIACLESQIKNENLSNTEELISFLESQDTLPLTDNELTEGLGHIESFELASELDICQTNIETPDFRTPFLSLSSSPTQTEDLMSSEINISEGIPRSVSPFHQFHFTDEPIVVPDIPQDNMLFGSNSAKNISRFLEGLLLENGQNITQPDSAEETNVVNKESVQSLLSEGIHTEQSFKNDLENLQNHPFETDSEKESTSTVEDGKEILSSIGRFSNEQQIKIHDPLPTMNKGSSNSNKTHATPETNLKKNVGLPKSVVSGIEPPVQINEETKEIKENLVSKNSVFDSESVANAIQLCLQDIKKSIPIVIQNEEESETIEVNNNITDINLCVSSVHSIMSSVQLEVNDSMIDETKCVKQEILVEDVNKQFLDEDNKNENQTTSNEKIDIPLDGMEQLIEPSTSEFHRSAENYKSDEIKTTRTSKEILEARAARLKRLEEQCKSLFTKMSATSRRSDLIYNKLEELHEHYGPSQISKFSDGECFSAPTTSTPVLCPLKNVTQQENSRRIKREASNSDPKVKLKRLSDTSLGATEVVTYTSDVDSDPCCSRRLEPTIILNENVISVNTNSENKNILDETLENHCKPLQVQVTKTNKESNDICNQVHELDEQLNQRSSQVSPENKTDLSNKQDNQTQESNCEEEPN